MQIIRLCCLIMLVGFLAHQFYQAPVLERSCSSPLPQRASGASNNNSPLRSIESQESDSRGNESHPAESSNKHAKDLASDDRIHMKSSPPKNQSDVMDRVGKDLSVLAQACFQYRKRQGEFPPSLATLKTFRSFAAHQRAKEYRFTYKRLHGSRSFTVVAEPLTSSSRMPRFSIDESLVISLKPT